MLRLLTNHGSIIVGKVENDSLKFYVIKVEDIPALNENTFNIILQRLVLNKRNLDSKRRDETILRFRWWGEVRRALYPYAVEMNEKK